MMAAPDIYNFFGISFDSVSIDRVNINQYGVRLFEKMLSQFGPRKTFVLMELLGREQPSLR